MIVFSPISFFFFNDTATTEIYTLSLHDALPILAARDRLRPGQARRGRQRPDAIRRHPRHAQLRSEEHTSESSHLVISYAVFCLKKKKKQRKSRCLQDQNKNPQS